MAALGFGWSPAKLVCPIRLCWNELYRPCRAIAFLPSRWPFRNLLTIYTGVERMKFKVWDKQDRILYEHGFVLMQDGNLYLIEPDHLIPAPAERYEVLFVLPK